MMFGRLTANLILGSTALVISFFSLTLSQTGGQAEVGAAPLKAEVRLPADSPESLQKKTREILSWTPTQKDRLDFALKGVTRIVMFRDFGLGDRLEVEMPRQSSRNWPVANSFRLYLGQDKTAVVARFKVDTLPGPRVRGEGMLGLIGVHADSATGRDIELQRTMASAGRLELVFMYGQLWGATSCCGLPTSFSLARYGKVSDTMTAILTFDPSLGKFLVSIIGPEAGRTFPGFSYTDFRTERGEFHRELAEYPYMSQNGDPDWVNLYVGSRFRGRKSQFEPVLHVIMF